MRVDAHQHFWALGRGDYGWLRPEMSVLYHDYLPPELYPLLDENKIEKTVVVQAAPTVSETHFLLQLVERYNKIAGVVGWLDLESPEFPKEFSSLSSNKYLVGLRPMIQDIPDIHWMLSPTVLENFRVLVHGKFPIDLLVRPVHLPVLLKFMNIFPNALVVIDHLAKPQITCHTLEPWRGHMKQLANYPNVFCKLSGMLTEADDDWSIKDFIPYVEVIYEEFGPGRIIFGSDWPVCLERATYAEVVRLTIDILTGLGTTQAELDQILGGNAVQFYGLDI